MIKGKQIDLVATTLADRQQVYEWCFQSETTKSHSGPPDYPEKKIATYREFCTDYYEEYYFNGTQPEKGQGFLIRNDQEAVGFISYSTFHLNPHSAELDIWLKDESNCGKGFGNEAILAMSEYLNQRFSIRLLLLAPSNKNIRAIKSYEKAGFKRTDKLMSEFVTDDYVSLYGSGDYGVKETAILVKELPI